MTIPPALQAAAADYGLGELVCKRLWALAEAVAGDPNAPTAAKGLAGVANHLLDSLRGLVVPELRGAATIADLGSGAGFPGLVLALALPAASVALIEANQRKARFLERLTAALGAANALVVPVRAEQWTAGLDSHDVVVARAVGPQPVVLEYAAPLLRLGGVVVEWRTERPAEEVRRGREAAALLGLRHLRDHPYGPGDRRRLEVFEKVEPTPARFPRRPGVALKRPLA